MIVMILGDHHQINLGTTRTVMIGKQTKIQMKKRDAMMNPKTVYLGWLDLVIWGFRIRVILNLMKSRKKKIQLMRKNTIRKQNSTKNILTKQGMHQEVQK